MKIVNMKMAVVAAVMAALAGGASLGVEQLKSLLVQHGRVLAGGHAAAFVAHFLMKTLQIMKHLKHNVKWIADKCAHVEQRVDAAAAKRGNVCRHMQKVFLEFDEAANPGLTVEVNGGGWRGGSGSCMKISVTPRPWINAAMKW